MERVFIFLILAVILISGCTIKDCGNDLTCFKNSAKDCSRAKVNSIYEDNNIRLISRGIWFGECRISLKINNIGERLRQQNPNLAVVIKGKTLNCAIPMEVIGYNNSQYIKELLQFENRFNQYCSGPIKDILQGPLKETIETRLLKKV